jgi:transcriptional regulator with XRE-family HTH domain
MIERAGPDPIDVQVGQRIREIRRRRGISQDQLARRVSLTFQQVQKYELGTNRVSASRLVHIASALGVPASDLLGEHADGSSSPVLPVLDPDLARLVARLGAIKSPGVRKSVIKLLNAVADLDAGEVTPISAGSMAGADGAGVAGQA